MEHKNIAEKLGLMDPLSHDKFVDQELQGLSDDLVGPLMVAWDVTNRCNLKCMHCLNRSGDERYHDFCVLPGIYPTLCTNLYFIKEALISMEHQRKRKIK